uniref:DUF4283 domain-containing protein n=1 Tax=Gossypium raimondii TaxID=29730 RepID=A0A0D2MB08_GOSRA|nr:hypothetical protein B456_002G144200 [Gossypium raimondii]
MEKGFDLKDGDVITEVVDEILLITFSDRVHQFIEWKNQLMDLENEFFLVRFHDIDDYNNVLAGGPWVVYGNYLTVRPWSPNFSTTCTDVNVQVVWICLPGLLEGLYSEVFIWAIGQTIELIIKLDINTNLAKRCRFARLATCIDL